MMRGDPSKYKPMWPCRSSMSLEWKRSANSLENMRASLAGKALTKDAQAAARLNIVARQGEVEQT